MAHCNPQAVGKAIFPWLLQIVRAIVVGRRLLSLRFMNENRYSPREIEEKWQSEWEKNSIHRADTAGKSEKKYYNLVMFPYPSGDKLHLGHWYNYGGADVWGRFQKMRGYKVLQPMGFDSFGLPAENYAIKTGIHPAESTGKNIAHMRQQIKKMGAMYDWDKEVITSDPSYYRWTQWLFLQLHKKGLAYRKNAAVNWCESCQTVLANEQVVEGKCERCTAEVGKKELPHWMFKITAYAEELLDFSGLDWPEKTVMMQKNWIGRKAGININYQIEGHSDSLTVFTTRPETNFGATFVVIAPEHPLVAKIVTAPRQRAAEKYLAQTRKKSEMERQEIDRVKTGVFTGSHAVNPLTGYRMPIYIADYVLMNFGTGAVVGVPAHDERDFEFAFAMGNIEIKRVIAGANGDESKVINVEQVRATEGTLINSEFLNGLTPAEAAGKISDYLQEKGWGEKIVNYRLHDWLISRQRYWGAPIPMIYCPACGEVPVPEEDLPVLLPEVKDYKPKGKSPLETNADFMKANCPRCGAEARREGDTMDTFVCSSWYYFRYLDNKNTQKPWSKKIANQWLPVDMYIGGPEHACMHLLYARFLHKAMRDCGLVQSAEPFKRLVHQGLITKDGAKMSKSKGNVVGPDEFVAKYGADVFRMYLMFMGPFEQGGDWNDRGITGVARFADRFWKSIRQEPSAESLPPHSLLHKTIKKVTLDLENFQFNTAIAALMEFLNAAPKTGLDEESKKTAVKLIAPLAPHLAEELWEFLGEKTSVFTADWPQWEEKHLRSSTLTIAVQINGKLRGEITVPADATEKAVLAAAKDLENAKRYLEGKPPRKEIYIAGKLVNFVV